MDAFDELLSQCRQRDHEEEQARIGALDRAREAEEQKRAERQRLRLSQEQRVYAAEVHQRLNGIVLINCTPHPVTIVPGTIPADGLGQTVMPSGEPLRLAETASEPVALGRLPLRTVAYGPADALPPKAEGVYYIVSLAIAQAVDRDDFVIPYPLVRDDEGRIVGCGGLARVERPGRCWGC